MDPGQLARLGSLRLYTAADSPDFHSRTGTVGCGRHLSLCRCLRRNGPSLAGNDSGLWRSRSVSALHLCADFPYTGLRRFFSLGSQRHRAGRVCLGRLAWDDANKGQVAEAKDHFQKASNLNPKLAQPHNYLGKVFMHEGDVDHAVLQFQEALRLHPDFPEAEENLRIAKQSETTNGHE